MQSHGLFETPGAAIKKTKLVQAGGLAGKIVFPHLDRQRLAIGLLGGLELAGFLMHSQRAGGDGPAQLWEVYDNTGATDSPFSFLEIRMDEDRGQGRLARGSDVELGADGKHLQIDDYASQPVPLQKVRRIE